ncbi:MAG TPA: bifunctional ADP-heptose synthase [Bacteroidales bacterium]|nr:bifunctional ADP-heptose synthase [Bacteroidales bacterium]
MNYSALFDSLSSKSIMVIGDVMLDSYIWGTVDRISPEAPVPVVKTKRTEHRLGGAANVAKNLVALGIKPLLFSVIGADEAGKNLCAVLEKHAISQTSLLTTSNRVTTVKTRIMSGNHQMLRLDTEQTDDLSDDLEQKLYTKITEYITHKQVSAIILQDYNKGVLTASSITNIIDMAKKHAIPVFVDPKKDNFTVYSNLALFKPNFKEFCEGVGVSCDKNDSVALYNFAREYMQSHAIERLMITLSEHGIFIANKSSEYIHLPTQVRQVADVSGAGDTVISVAAACIVAGLPDIEVARISNIAAGLACEMLGVVSITKEQLLKHI